jgi:hypothetical protein
MALNAGNPIANSTVQIIDSSEGIAVYWTALTTAEIQGFVFGRLWETVDGNTAYWMLNGFASTGDNAAATTGWSLIPSGSSSPPLASALNQWNNGPATRGWAIGFKAGILYGFGKIFDTISGSSINQGYTGPDGAVLQAFILGGGVYTAQSDNLQGIYRQVRLGPSAYRGQKLYSGGIEQAICLNYATLAVGQKPGGLWFDHFR